jgi:hypothetical protein
MNAARRSPRQALLEWWSAGEAAEFGFKAHPHMLRHACGFALANKGHDTRALQAYLGHKNIQHTMRYAELSPDRFKDFWLVISRSSTRLFERASHLGANLSRFLCGGLQLGLKKFDLNAEGVLKVLGAQKPLAEVSVGGSLPLNVCLEGAYLLLIGAWKGSHDLLDQINVALRGASDLFEIFKHHGSNGFFRLPSWNPPSLSCGI